MLKSLWVGIASLCAAQAMALPQYQGSTHGSELTNRGSLDAGYYLWNNQSSPLDWSIRWVGSGADTKRVQWAGLVSFDNGGLNDYSEYKFEKSDQSIGLYDLGGGQDILAWYTVTNNTGGVDGIDFTLASSVELLQFSLASSLFLDSPTSLTDPGVKATSIYIGSDFTAPEVLSYQGIQSFQVNVPEPYGAGLILLGLLGLVWINRRQAKPVHI